MQAIKFGALDHVTFELGLATQFWNFFRGGGWILDVKKNNNKKSCESLERKRHIREFKYSPDILAAFHRQKSRQNVFSYRPREGLVRSHAIAVSRALSTEQNKSAVFHQRHLHYNLSAVIRQKGPRLSPKKKKMF